MRICKRIKGEKKMSEMEGSGKNVKAAGPTSRLSVLDMVYTGLLSAVICVCSILAINIGEVPITLQTFAVCTAAGLLGWKRGSACVLVYVLLGAVGIPVFGGMTGGIGVLTGSTGGYIIGFIFTALIVGFAADKFDRSVPALLISMILGVLVCYAFGTAWFMFLTKLDLMTALSYCVFPFLIFDAIKIVLATVIVNRVSSVIRL